MSTPRTRPFRTTVQFVAWVRNVSEEGLIAARSEIVGRLEELESLETELQSAEAKLAVMAEVLSGVQLKLRRAGHHMTADEINVALSKLPERAQRFQALIAAAVKVKRVESVSQEDYGPARRESYWDGVRELVETVRAYQGDSDG